MTRHTYQPLWVTAELASPLAAEPPYLEALLEWCMSLFFLDKTAKIEAVEPWKVTRDRPAPPQGVLPIFIQRQQLGPWQVARCSNPVMSSTAVETVEYISKRLATEESVLLREGERKIVSTTNSWTKSYRLPLRIRIPRLVRWCCFGQRREILKLLRRVSSLSKKRSDGYGRVLKWTAEPAAEDYSWYAPHTNGTLLMRTLPVGDWLPKDLIGYRRDYGACVPPMWHPEHYGEIVAPC